MNVSLRLPHQVSRKGMSEPMRSHSLHPTNAGKAAKALRLDFVEVLPEVASEGWKLQKRYSVLDIPLIFEQLHALVANRAKYQ